MATENENIFHGIMPSDPLEAAAWFGCVQWAINEPDMLNAYRAETGDTWTPGKTGFEKMIDEACGADRAFIRAFAKWVTVNVWGDEDTTP